MNLFVYYSLLSSIPFPYSCGRIVNAAENLHAFPRYGGHLPQTEAKSVVLR